MINKLETIPATLTAQKRKPPEPTGNVDKVTLTLSQDQDQMGTRAFRDFVQHMKRGFETPSPTPEDCASPQGDRVTLSRTSHDDGGWRWGDPMSALPPRPQTATQTAGTFNWGDPLSSIG